MNCRSERKKYSDWLIPDDLQRKLDLSAEGAEDLEYRAIRCSRCNKILFYAGSDCRDGHIKILCNRCKYDPPLSLKLFHTRKRRRNGNEGYLNRG